MRIYNPMLARFFSVDPITRQYPELTPYQFASNTPVQAVDLDGLEAVVLTIGGRGTFLLVSVALNANIVVAPNGISLYITPEGGLGTGISGSAGGGISYFHNIKNSEDLGGWGYNIGGSFNGNGYDYSGAIATNDNNDPTGVTHGGGRSIPKVGGGAGAEGHFTATYSFLVGTVTWDELESNLESWAKEAGISVDELKQYIKKAKSAYEDMVKDLNIVKEPVVKEPDKNKSSGNKNIQPVNKKDDSANKKKEDSKEKEKKDKGSSKSTSKKSSSENQPTPLRRRSN